MAESETFQHYQVLRKPDGALHELGRGAMGVTYKAFDTNLRCNVALKVINAAYLDSDMARQRFLREARAAAGLSHPNVASVFHLGEEGGNYFYAMEFIDGETLEAFVRRLGPLPPVLALRIALQVTRALRAAAKEGLVHRDIKPANLMLLREDEDESGADERHVKVIDFGLAKVTRSDGEASATITVAGFVGTPHFASPEQLEEKDLDVRSDMYSLGVTLWYMLTGRPPFAGSLVQIMSQHLTRPPAFANLTGQPPEVVHLLEHLLEKDPARRPQTPSDLRREIEQAIAALGVRAAPHPGTGGETDGALYETEAATGDAGLASDQPITSPPPATGVVLDGRYRLVREVGQSPRGTLFQALELDTGRAVALKVLNPGSFAAPEALQAAQLQTDQARLAPHPNLLRIQGLERLGIHTALIYEWVNGFSLLDVLRNRHELSVGEALQILAPLAAVADHARTQGLPALNLTPAEALLAFDPGVDLPTRTALLAEPLSSWPVFQVKLLPLSLAPEAGGSATWSGLQTMLPATTTAPATAVRQLALLTYELLGDAAPAGGASQRHGPLPALGEDGNAVLQNALAQRHPPHYANAAEFVRALGVAVGPQPVVPSPRPKPAPVAKSASPPPPLPVTPPPPPPARPAPAMALVVAAPAPKGRGLMIALSLGILVIFLGGLGGLTYVAWKVLARRTGGGGNLVIHDPAPSPTVAPEQPTPVPPPQATPTPVPTAPPVSRDAVVKEKLAEATRLDNAGDEPGALAAYVRLAEEYPDLDPGWSRVESYVSAIRAKTVSPELEARRFAGLRSSMERAAKGGLDLAMLYLGNHLAANEPEAAADWYRKAADKGQTEAMVELGNMYFKGRGVPLDPSQVAVWYQRASDKGNVKAKVYLAECYELGKGGVRVDYNRAAALLNEALNVEPNYAKAIEKLAIAYEKGHGVAPNPRKAFELMTRASELGDINATGSLAAYYASGLGTGQPNLRKAAEMFKEGAEKNNPFCLYGYARCLENGFGVKANRAEAITFYRAAAQGGVPPAQQWCRENGVSFTFPGNP